MKLSRVLRISRPRFWIYELGPYMIGVLWWFLVALNNTNSEESQALIWHFWSIKSSRIAFYTLYPEAFIILLLLGFYFLIPANIWIYWINDIYDYETDKLNPKKLEWYEALVTPKEQKKLRYRILWTTLPFVIILCMYLLWWMKLANWFQDRSFTYIALSNIWEAGNIGILCSFFAFLFFSGQYSAKPIRAKARPILDSFFSAWHYIATAVFGYLLVNPAWDINRYYVIAGMARAMAMHAFSAVPDIQADKDAKLATIATWLWWKATIRVCFGLYLLASVLSYSFLWRVSVMLGVVYCWLMMWAATLYGDEKKVFALYKRFPWINTVSGMILFFVVLLKIL